MLASQFLGCIFLVSQPLCTISAICLAAQWDKLGYETWTSYELLLLLRVIFLIRVPGLKQAQRGASGWTQGAQQHRPCCWWSLGTSAALTARPELGDVACRVGDPRPGEPAACPLRWAGRPPVPVRENSAGSQELVTAALLMTSLWFWATPSALFESAPLSVKRG